MSNSVDKTPCWIEIPGAERCITALSWMFEQRKRKSIRTIIFKVIVSSNKRERNLLKSFWYVTYLKHRVLEALREDISAERPDGAFALTVQMLQIRAKKGEKASDQSTTLGNLIEKFFNQNCLTQDDYYFSAVLRQGVYRDAALTILTWCTSILELSNDIEKYDLYQAWQSDHILYQKAANSLIPFGRNKGKKLSSVGRRELIWLLERIITEDVLSQALHALEILLGIRNANTREEIEQAALTEHPWKRTLKHNRTVRERRLNTRILDSSSNRVLLESLSDIEKEHLYDELLEQKQLHSEYAEIRQAIETVLYKRPPRFPSVASVAHPEDEETAQDQWRDYWATLDRFRSPFPSRPTKPIDEYSMEELEELEPEAVSRMLRARSALDRPRYQPLSFKRSMKPSETGGYNAFGLLRDSETGVYVLALALSGRESLRQHRLNPVDSVDQKEVMKGLEHFSPQVGKNLEFFNFPVPFCPKPSTSIMLFSLEYDAEYHDQKHLAPLYDRIRTASAPSSVSEKLDSDVKYEEDTSKSNRSIELLTPLQDKSSDDHLNQVAQKKRGKRAPIASARISCSWAKDGKPEFYLHLPIPVFEDVPPSLPQTVLGIHEHDTGYSYALISFMGDVIKTGDLDIETSVVPRVGDRTYNPNYANEVAIAILELAQKHNAYIGIEDTSYLRQINISRTRNRRFFGRPSKKIATIVSYKALEYGLLAPRMVWKVSPSRDCSQCGHRLDTGKSGIRRVLYVVCPACNIRQPFQKDDLHVQSCTGCGYLWRAHEAWVEREFVCSQCHSAPLIARMNTAIVVAFKAIQGVVEYYEHVHTENDDNLHSEAQES